MGKKPDEIYREIIDHRQAMSREKAGLERRIRDDLAEVKERAGQHTPSVFSDIGDRMAEHPISFMMGAFGTGVAAGMLTPGVNLSRFTGGNNGHHEDDGSSSRNGNSSNGFLMSSLTGALSGTVVTAVEDTVRPVLNDIMAGFRGDERRPEERSAN